MSQTATDQVERPTATRNAITVRIPLRVVLSGAAGAALMYFLDPQQGRHRWTTLRDRTAGSVRRASRRVQRVGRRTAAEAYAIKQKVTHLRPEDTFDPNDADLVQRVESEVFRDPDIPKGEININAEDGKIVLRGQMERPDQIRAIEKAVRKVHGVREVENLLHLP